MKKQSRITVQIGAFGTDPEEYELPKDSTVADALEEAGLDDRTKKVYVNGETANRQDILEDGDVLNVVSPKQAGNN